MLINNIHVSSQWWWDLACLGNQRAPPPAGSCKSLMFHTAWALISVSQQAGSGPGKRIIVGKEVLVSPSFHIIVEERNGNSLQFTALKKKSIYIYIYLVLTNLPANTPHVSTFRKVLDSAKAMNFDINSSGTTTPRNPPLFVLRRLVGLLLRSTVGTLE